MSISVGSSDGRSSGMDFAVSWEGIPRKRRIKESQKILIKMNSEITPETIRIAYKLILNREPESQQAIESHLAVRSLEELGQVMIKSEEYRAKSDSMESVLKSHWIAVEVMEDFIQWIDVRDKFVSRGCMQNNWEPNETAYFTSRVGSGDVVLDIGANIGWFTLLGAKLTGSKGRVYSFEPRPETAKMLRRTIAHNNLQNQVDVFETAVSDRRGELKLAVVPNAENPGGSFLITENILRDSIPSVSVKTAPLDELLEGVKADFVKIDVEGAEPMVFAGAKKTIQRSHPIILSELHPKQLKEVSNFSPREYIELMERYGYKCFLLENGKPTDQLVDYPRGRSEDLVSVVFEIK
jgi:FkbM family methyltransferase